MSEPNASIATFDVADVTVNIPSMKDAVSAAITDARHGRGFCLFTLNLDHCVKLRAEPQFRNAYREARYVTADGFPIVLIGRLKGIPVSRTTGADLVLPLCAQAARHGLPVFLLGPSAEVLRRAGARMVDRLPRLQIVGSYAPGPNFDPHSGDADAAIESIRRSGARLCVVALGGGRGEIFAARCLARTPEVGFVCVGAALDFLSGRQRRAPRFLREHGLEWLWRLLTDPRRLAARYLRCAAVFPRLVAEAVPQIMSGPPRRA
ncbi:MAG: WecB/TagA/CpsF family glycosyltransferase [Pseudolabrys sp.]|nr:WecB/TagA/CpsF family glycosyltransferase [Pseudolabrys sp.]